MEKLAIGAILLLLLVRVAVFYVLVPFVLMKVLAFVGVAVSFGICVGICFLVYFVFMVFGQVLKS